MAYKREEGRLNEAWRPTNWGQIANFPGLTTAQYSVYGTVYRSIQYEYKKG